MNVIRSDLEWLQPRLLKGASDERVSPALRAKAERLSVITGKILSRGTDFDAQVKRLALRLRELLEQESNPLPAMHEAVDAAERSGLIVTAGSIRMETPELFVQDLLLDNIVASEWISQQRHPRADVRLITELCVVIDQLR